MRRVERAASSRPPRPESRQPTRKAAAAGLAGRFRRSGHDGCYLGESPEAARSCVPLSIDDIESEARRLTDRYEFLRELGRGGTAVVYLAREVATGQIVAL